MGTEVPRMELAAKLVQRDAPGGLLAVALSSPGAVVLVEGEAGIGKTRLVHEVLARVPLADATTYVGHCYPSGSPRPCSRSWRRCAVPVRSTDGGRTFAPLVGSAALRPVRLVADRTDPLVLAAVVAIGPQHRLVVSPDGGTTFRPVTDTDIVDDLDVAGLPGGGSALLAAGPAGLVLSSNHGATWQQVARGAFSNVRFESSSGSALMAVRESRLVRSPDTGVTTKPAEDGLPPCGSRTGARRPDARRTSDVRRPVRGSLLRLPGRRLRPRPGGLGQRGLTRRRRLRGDEHRARADADRRLPDLATAPHREQGRLRHYERVARLGRRDALLHAWGVPGPGRLRHGVRQPPALSRLDAAAPARPAHRAVPRRATDPGAERPDAELRRAAGRVLRRRPDLGLPLRPANRPRQQALRHAALRGPEHLLELRDVRVRPGHRPVVRTPLSRRTPTSSSVRIARSTDPADTSGSTVRRRQAVIFLRPYSPSGVSRRCPWVSVLQATSRTASTTWASLMVRAATGRLICLQLR